LTSLNLNGIRSAARKGLQAWVQEAAPDCICVQELRARELRGLGGRNSALLHYLIARVQLCHMPADTATAVTVRDVTARKLEKSALYETPTGGQKAKGMYR